MKIIGLVALLVGLSGLGCVYPTMITKSVTIERDEAGKILKRIEMETATQQVGDRRIILEWIKMQEPPPRPPTESPFQSR